LPYLLEVFHQSWDGHALVFLFAQQEHFVDFSAFRTDLVLFLTVFEDAVLTGVKSVPGECESFDPVMAKVAFDLVDCYQPKSHLHSNF
jgi:hypothetical protein